MTGNKKDYLIVEDKSIFITGATGLVGSNLTKKLTEQNKKIKALYRGEIPFTSANIEWIKGDLFDTVLLEEAMQDVDEVYHCAAKVSFYPKEKQQLFKTNVEGTANIVNACINTGVKKLLLLSKFTFAKAVPAVSFVMNGALPVNILFIASNRHTVAAIKDETFLYGGFLLKHPAIILNKSL